MEKKNVSTDNIEYTIVMDPSFTQTGGKGSEKDPVSADKSKRTAGNSMDTLYAEYEMMCLREPTVLDSDDAYPHSYQWRLLDRYDPAKIALLKKAVEEGKKIADLEAYQEFLEDVSSRRIEANIWE